MKLFICGFSGAGKSTLGEKLSKHPEFQVFDLDEEIYNRMGSGYDNLGEYIEAVGLSAFRDDELDMIQLLDQNFKDNYLIILGGGALDTPELFEFIKKVGGRLVFIDAPFEVCWSRLEKCEDRPLAKTGKEAMKELYMRRLPMYQLASLTIGIDTIHEIETIEDIISLLD
jgi:shikimate kinase